MKLDAESLPMRIYVISHTHWDREWYLSQRQFQYLLGDTIDEVLEACEQNPLFPPFMADGQTSLVTDYLEIRPDRKERLLTLIKQGRILIGPWCTMPDLWLPDGESLIRNLLAGRRDCRGYGAEQPLIGYVPDSFGHIEQMPQILQGFGFTHYLFARGEPSDTKLNGLEFIWEGPDGQSELISHLLPDGYLNGMMLPAANEAELLRDTLVRAARPYTERSACRQLGLLLNGVDHIWLQRDIPEILAKTQDLLPGFEFIPGGLKDYLDDFVARPANLKRHRGILQGSKLNSGLLHGTWSSRIDLKLDNARTMMILESWAEPLSALAGTLLHGKSRSQEIDLAWRLLLQNHAHDSICGCSIDRVNDDVHQRFIQSQEISEMVAGDALSLWSEVLSASAQNRVLVAAGLGGRAGAVEVIVDSLDQAAPVILDTDGSVIPTQYLGRRLLVRQDALVNRDRPQDPDYLEIQARSFEFWEHRLLIKPPAVPPCSVYAYVISSEGEPALISDPVTVEERSLENSLLRVEVAANGTLHVLHKASGLTYAGLLELRDEADAGGSYMFLPIEGEPVHRSVECEAQVSILERGPLRAGLRIEAHWLLPAAVDSARKSRMAETQVCDWDAEMYLEAASDTLHFRGRLTNRAKDHRIRLAFPMPFTADRVQVERSFVVTEESPARYEAEPGQNSHAMRNWVAVDGPAGGVAFIGKGLHEWTLQDNRLEVTALRSVPFVGLCGSWSIPDGLMLGELTFDFALAFYTGTWREGHVASRAAEIVHSSLAEAYGQSVPAWTSSPHASILLEEESQGVRSQVSSHRSTWRRHFAQRDGWRRNRQSALEAVSGGASFCIPVRWKDPNILLSAFKKADGDEGLDLILRFYSLATVSEVEFGFGFRVTHAFLTDMREEVIRELTLNDNSVRLTMRPFEIVTLRVQVATEAWVSPFEAT